MSEYPVDAKQILKNCDIDYEVLRSRSGFILLEQLFTLLQVTSEATLDPCFGLKLSTKQSHATLGMVGMLMEKSPNLRVAVQNSIKYMKLHADGMSLNLKEEGNLALFTVETNGSFIYQQAVIDLVIGISCNVVRTLSNRYDAIDSVYLTHANPSSGNLYRKLLGAPVTFDHEFSAIVYKRELLNTPLAEHNELYYQELSRRLDLSLNESCRDFISTVRQCIRESILLGEGMVDPISSKLGLSRQQLQRRLSKDNTTFSKLLEQERKMVAQQKLLYSNISITQLSEQLGYSDQTAFGRAFQRWFGVRPNAWRNANRAKDIHFLRRHFRSPPNN